MIIKFDYNSLSSISQNYGDSFFILDGNKFTDNFLKLQSSFQNSYGPVKIGYSYKTNYTPELCSIVNELGGFAEVVSEMELSHARKLNVAWENIVYNGPYKSFESFKSALLGGSIVNIDNKRDIHFLELVASDAVNSKLNVVIRINFPLDDSNLPSRFGLDIDGSEFINCLSVITKYPNISFRGLHCHFPDRNLNSFSCRAKKLVQVIDKYFNDVDFDIINIGGGFMSQMPPTLLSALNLEQISFDDYANTIADVLNSYFVKNKPVLFLEPGTALVADCQYFVTKVVATKVVRDKNFAFVSGSIFDISPIARSKHIPFSIVPSVPLSPSSQPVTYDIAGFTCIESDILSFDYNGIIDVGDFVCYSNVGSYSIVMRPPFILPSFPILFSYRDLPLRLIKSKQSPESLFSDFASYQ